MINKRHVHALMLRVGRNNGPSSLGQDWLQFLQLNYWKANATHSASQTLLEIAVDQAQ